MRHKKLLLIVWSYVICGVSNEIKLEDKTALTLILSLGGLRGRVRRYRNGISQKGANMKDFKRIDAMRQKVDRIHFVGIGGIGMSGIAEVLINLGYKISGSDLVNSDATERLTNLGARVCVPHKASNVGKADVVVTSTAVRADNPEVLIAQAKGIPVIPRAEMLAELLKMKFSVAVSGSHGKTTTTSIISTILAYGDFDPTMVIGGKLSSIGSNAKIGSGEIIVAEADESDRSFLKLNPTVAVITNIDLEHVDHYRDIDDIKDAFLKFANIVPFYGFTVIFRDDENVKAILPAIKRRIVTCGTTAKADYWATDIIHIGYSSKFLLHEGDESLGVFDLNVPGRFNVYNAIVSIATALELGMPLERVREGLKTFTGVHRRLEVKGDAGGVRVVDDYGHHPTEIKEALLAARKAWEKGKLITVFQPHRYTRTKGLFKEFLSCFDNADALILMDIYAASEEPIAGISAENLCAEIKKAGHKDVCHISNPDEIVRYLLEKVKAGDTVITQGAGSVYKIGETLLKEMVTRKR